MIEEGRLVIDGKRQWGRFETTPIANPLDEFIGAERFWKNFRLKEWAGFTIVHPDIFCSMIMQDAKYVKSSELYVYHRHSKVMDQHNAIGGKFLLGNDLMHNAPIFNTKGYHIQFDFSDERIMINVDIKSSRSAKPVRAELILDVPDSSKPLVVSAKLPVNGSMYTNKIIFPASGYIQVGDVTYELNKNTDMAILDEHKSHLPYHTQWTWGTFAMPMDGNFIGANFATRPQFSDQQEESGLWTPDKVEPLADIHFDKKGSETLSPWHIYSKDGRLDVLFTPEGHKRVDHQFVVASIKYAQLYGTYKGSIKGANKSWEFSNVNGVCETMDMRC